jgi:ABC-2 type transport system ATP-binding protein
VGTPALEIDQVSKTFKLYQEKLQSAKERIIMFGRAPYEEFEALSDISFDVAEGETVGILGHNGSGKSTLLKCITGTLRPTSGTIRTRGRVAALLELGAGFAPDLTGRENVYLNGSILGLSRPEVDKVYDQIVEFSELGEFMDTQVKRYSSGMYGRLGFSVAVHLDPDVLLIDEVLAVGDEAFQRKCIERIKHFQTEGRTILLVTHMADIVRRICDRVVVLDHGKLVTVDKPGRAVRTFRETLLERGIDVATELHDPEEGTEPRRVLSGDVRFTKVAIEYPNGGKVAKPGDPVVIRMAYEAPTRVDDVVFAVNIHDQEGNLLMGANSDVLGSRIDRVEGNGEASFVLDSVPLLDGTYKVSLGIHTHDGGHEYDHREELDAFQVMHSGEIIGLVHFPMRFVDGKD